MKAAFDRARRFADRLDIRIPIVLAPMAGACPPSLSIAVGRGGGLGGCGALLMKPDEIVAWADEVRGAGAPVFQMNLWLPDPEPVRDPAHEARLRTFLEAWGPPVPAERGDIRPLDFAAQCDALIAARAPVVSSIMGLFPQAYVARLKDAGILWFATVTTVAEAKAAAAAGADVIVAQGGEAGGHRGAFDAGRAETELVGLFSLLPAIVDAVDVPVVATGGVADARGIVAALALGASAVQIGTGFLRCPEARINATWADALARTLPEDTLLTRAFSGRPGRSIANDFTRAFAAPDAPEPAPHPVQRGLAAPMKAQGAAQGNLQRMQAWAGQSAALARAVPADELVRQLWDEARALAG